MDKWSYLIAKAHLSNIEHYQGVVNDYEERNNMAVDKSDTVTIPRSEYESLLDDSVWRSCLEAGGVDNWSYYSDALSIGGYFADDLEESDDE